MKRLDICIFGYVFILALGSTSLDATMYYPTLERCEVVAAHKSVTTQSGDIWHPCGVFTSYWGRFDLTNNGHPTETLSVTYGCKQITPSKYEVYIKSWIKYLYKSTERLIAPLTPRKQGWGHCYALPYAYSLASYSYSLCTDKYGEQHEYLSGKTETSEEGLAYFSLNNFWDWYYADLFAKPMYTIQSVYGVDSCDANSVESSLRSVTGQNETLITSWLIRVRN